MADFLAGLILFYIALAVLSRMFTPRSYREPPTVQEEKAREQRRIENDRCAFCRGHNRLHRTPYPLTWNEEIRDWWAWGDDPETCECPDCGGAWGIGVFRYPSRIGALDHFPRVKK